MARAGGNPDFKKGNQLAKGAKGNKNVGLYKKFFKNMKTSMLLEINQDPMLIRKGIIQMLNDFGDPETTPQARVQIANLLFDRIDGKAIQQVEVTHDKKVTFTFKDESERTELLLEQVGFGDEAGTYRIAGEDAAGEGEGEPENLLSNSRSAGDTSSDVES